jgi:hypothetical protein
VEELTMRNDKLLISVIITVWGSFCCPGVAQDSPTPGALLAPERDGARPVEVGLAQTVAQEMLPVFYEGDWSYFAHFPYYDVDGKLRAHAFVFSRQTQTRSESADGQSSAVIHFRNVADLEEVLKQEDERIGQLSMRVEQVRGWGIDPVEGSSDERSRLIDERAEARAGLHRQDEFATVITGVSEDMPPVLKCYRGLPLALVAKSEALAIARERDSGTAWQFRNFLYLDRFTEAVAAGSPTDQPDLEHQDQQVVVDLRSRKITPLAELRRRLREARQERRLRAPGLDPSAVEQDQIMRRNKEMWQAWRQRVRARKRGGVGEPTPAPTGPPLRVIRGRLPREN